jgi:ribosome-associated protein
LAQEPATSSKELALYAAQLASEKKGHDLKLMEVGRVSIVADYFLICTGNTSIQVNAICEHLLENLKLKDCYTLRIEGLKEAWWVVLDYGFLVIHVFQPEARAFYDLERLWYEAPQLFIDGGSGSLPLTSD